VCGKSAEAAATNNRDTRQPVEPAQTTGFSQRVVGHPHECPLVLQRGLIATQLVLFEALWLQRVPLFSLTHQAARLPSCSISEF
jgi:hypothetical protein